MKKLLICLLIFVGAIFISCNFVINATTTKTVPEQPTIQTEPLSLIVEASAPSADILLEEEPAPTPEQEPLATREEIELLALCAMAEAEGECEQGQRLVIDSVLNRVDDPHFPDTISEVIWQKNQYAGMYGDRITRCYVIVSCGEGDHNDPYAGFCAAITKRVFGSTSHAKKILARTRKETSK